MENFIQEKVAKAIKDIYQVDIQSVDVQTQKTRKDFRGDITVVVFPFLKHSKKPPPVTATEIGEYLKNSINEIDDFEVVKGFLNLEINKNYWLKVFTGIYHSLDNLFPLKNETSQNIVVEYSSPNTNKPLHLGHVRNNLLGYSVAEILKANGHKVFKVNLVNDRGIHICKSMLAWKKWGNGETPESLGKKGDHLVGDYYVKFDVEYKNQVLDLVNKGMAEADAKKEASLLSEAQEMLRKWEAGDKEVVKLWKTMNNWVYEGFNETYKNLGVDFDEINYESETYLLGKNIVLEGLDKGLLFRKEDSSVWGDLTDKKLDQKLLLRSDGTSVYMTQDIGTAKMRHDKFNADKMMYVVGNEQDYHFQVLSHILTKLGFDWGKEIFHLSYGMVELPEGKMKSREGKVVDADDLMQEMIETAKTMSKELGKLKDFEGGEAENTFRIIGLGALKYFMLKVDPKKNMTFNPRESIDFNGNTGSFIQYTYARIQSLLRRAKEQNIQPSVEKAVRANPNEKEVMLIKQLTDFQSVVKEAGENYSPALIANYVYNLTKEYNQFYHDYSILKEPGNDIMHLRLILSSATGKVVKMAFGLLGIDVPVRM